MERIYIYHEVHPFGRIKCQGSVENNNVSFITAYHNGTPCFFWERKGNAEQPKVPCYPFSWPIIRDIEDKMRQKIQSKK